MINLLAAEGGYQVFDLKGGEMAWLFFSVATALLAIVVGFSLMRGVLAADQGTPKMQEIAKAIQEGAMAYLKRQFRTIGFILIPLAIIVFVTSTEVLKPDDTAALSFAEAAAHAAPEHPRYAWLVGRLMRSHGDPRGGERWLRRALKLAVAQRDWETQARALTGLGNLCVETGRYPEAKELHARALRVSRRWRLREQEGMKAVDHDVFPFSLDRRAMSVVRPGVPRPRIQRVEQHEIL